MGVFAWFRYPPVAHVVLTCHHWVTAWPRGWIENPRRLFWVAFGLGGRWVVQGEWWRGGGGFLVKWWLNADLADWMTGQGENEARRGGERWIDISLGKRANRNKKGEGWRRIKKGVGRGRGNRPRTELPHVDQSSQVKIWHPQAGNKVVTAIFFFFILLPVVVQASGSRKRGLS